MNSALLLGSLVLMWTGIATCLAQSSWGRRRPLALRVTPYVDRSTTIRAERSGLEAAGSGADRHPGGGRVAAVLSPAVLEVLDRISRALGAHDDLRLRLVRADDRRDITTFRAQQLAGTLIATCLGGVAGLVLGAAGPTGVALVLGAPMVWILGTERRLDQRISERQRRVRLELPVVAEQLGILIAAGYSLPAALQRLAERGRGATALELGQVGRDLRRGVHESTALAGWARRSGLPAVARLTRVLAMHRDAGDLGRLVSAEARATRAETHRALVETIERRSQLVWIPVTVATLVPGLILLAVPFVSALRQVTG